MRPPPTTIRMATMTTSTTATAKTATVPARAGGEKIRGDVVRGPGGGFAATRPTREPAVRATDGHGGPG